MISLQCPQCGQQLDIDDNYAGQAGACDKCGASIRVPDFIPDPLPVKSAHNAGAGARTQTPAVTPSPLPPARVPRVWHMYSKVYGVSHNNPDGSSRQQALIKCSPGEMLTIEPEPHNIADRSALALMRNNGCQVGYVNANLSKEFASKLCNGWEIVPFVKRVTGGGSYIFGLNIIFVLGEPGASYQSIHKYHLDLEPRGSVDSPRPFSIEATRPRARKACYHCGGRIVQKNKSTDSGAGCIVLLIGIFLAPILIGIPILIWGIVLMSRAEHYRVCTQCGQRYG